MPRLFNHEDISEAIRGLFIRLGGNVPMRVLAKAIIDRKVLSDEAIERCTMRGLISECRRALRAKTEEGLPYAQPTGRGARTPWRQLDLFTQPMAFALLHRRSQNILEDHEELRRLWAWCLEKFGVAPNIPDLIMPDDTNEDPRAEYDADPA